MKKYAITIKATVEKTLIVLAETAEAAVTEAHEEFSVLCDNDEERYEQETQEVKEIQ